MSKAIFVRNGDVIPPDQRPQHTVVHQTVEGLDVVIGTSGHIRIGNFHCADSVPTTPEMISEARARLVEIRRIADFEQAARMAGFTNFNRRGRYFCCSRLNDFYDGWMAGRKQG